MACNWSRAGTEGFVGCKVAARWQPEVQGVEGTAVSMRPELAGHLCLGAQRVTLDVLRFGCLGGPRGSC